MIVPDHVGGGLRKRPEPTQIMDGSTPQHRPVRSARRATAMDGAPPPDDRATPTSLPEQGTFPTFLAEMVPIGQLHPDPANANRMSDEELDALENGMRRFGFVQPIVARRDGTVVGGHQRLILSLIHISEPTRRTPISYAVFCLKKK